MSEDDSRQGPRQPASPPHGLLLEVLRARFAVCRQAPESEVPSWATEGSFSSISRSVSELSIICEERQVVGDLRCERGWRAVRVLGPAEGQEGPIDFALIGVLASLAVPLAKARVSLFSVSTYDTDYILVRAKKLGKALAMLRREGHKVVDEKRPQPDRPTREATTVDEKRPRPAQSTREVTIEDERQQHPQPARAVAKPAAREMTGKMTEEALVKDALEQVEKVPAAAARTESKSVPKPAARSESEPKQWHQPAAAVATPAASAEATSPRVARPTAVAESTPSAKPVQTRRSRRSGDDDGAVADGLATGAIPQHPVATTEGGFADLGLSAEIVAAVHAVGFEHPTPIQAGVIPHALEGRDIIGLAETGSGKTAAFVLPIAARLHHGKGTRGVIVCPTREIALQTKAFLDLFSKNHHLKTVCVIGGVRMQPQIDSLRRGVDLIVATPGRLLDHMERGNVHLEGIKMLVLDEADHMLDLGFQPQINNILRQLPEGRQTMLFSATMRPAIKRMAQQYTHDPEMVDIRPKGHAAQGIDHRLYLVDDRDKNPCLVSLLNEIEGSTLIFTRRRLHAEWLSRLLERENFAVDRIHSDRSQAQRVRALRDFRDGKYRILVATDVAARGLDIPVIRHVINFGLPETAEDYVHRAGRTARGTALGTVSSIGTWLSKPMVRDIESILGEKLPRFQAEGIEPYQEIKRRKTIRRRLL